jgi:hypothetical protein
MGKALENVTETATGFGRDVKDSVVEFGRSMGGKIDTARARTGDALSNAAASVREASARIDVLAGSAAHSLDAAGSVVKEANLNSVRRGLRRFAGNNLTATVMAAIVLGYFIGAAFGRKSAT